MLKIVNKIKIKICVVAISLGLSLCANSAVINHVELTVEELRIDKALKSLPNVAFRLSARVDDFASQLNKATNYTVLTQLVIRHGKGLWLDQKKSFNQLNDFDDRPLYWARLQMSKALRTAKAFGELFPNQQRKLLWTFELLSRGQKDVKFDKKADKKILLTGFDPFFLDRHIDQSNPSGVVALSLDDLVVSIEGQTAEIEVLILPVRFADFDQGMIEELLAPYIQNKSVDMVLTISMGRENFDLERFPALRRSANAPDNLNVLTGATKNNPLVPKLNNSALQGPEFVEFSLPISAMLKGAGKYQVNDNRTISTLSGGTFNGQALTDIVKQTSVSGSGGGYLSNEISYRSILLRDQYNLTLPVGHIHTPKIKAFDQQALMNIVNQTKSIITQGVADL
ncbi:MAG: pyrrolidone-carboxylate peptidase [Cognaticolwellia sp.]|jgi:pyrrolidone-carboxylate peptidase